MTATSEQSEVTKLNILVVDDDDDIRYLIAEILRKEGYGVTGASSAVDAEKVIETKIPDLILMDIGMPGVDGLSAVWRMRKRRELSEVPILIVSAHDSFDLRAEAAAEGCKGYLTKPLDPAVLLATVRELLR